MNSDQIFRLLPLEKKVNYPLPYQVPHFIHAFPEWMRARRLDKYTPKLTHNPKTGAPRSLREIVLLTDKNLDDLGITKGAQKMLLGMFEAVIQSMGLSRGPQLSDLSPELLLSTLDWLNLRDIATFKSVNRQARALEYPPPKLAMAYVRIGSINGLRALYEHPNLHEVEYIDVSSTFFDCTQNDVRAALGAAIKLVTTPPSAIPANRYIGWYENGRFVSALPMVWLARITKRCPKLKGIDLSRAPASAFNPSLNLGFLDLATVLYDRRAWFQPPESFPVSTILVKQKDSSGVHVEVLFHVEFIDFGRKLMDVSNNVVSSRLMDLNLYPFHKLVPGGRPVHATWRIRNVTLFDPAPLDIDVKHDDLYETVGIDTAEAYRFKLPAVDPNSPRAAWRGMRVTLSGDVLHHAFATLTRFGLDKSVCQSLICQGDAFDSYDVRDRVAYWNLMEETKAFMIALLASPWQALNRLVLGPPMFLLDSAEFVIRFFRTAAVGMPNLVDLTLLTTHAPVIFVLAAVEPLLRRPRCPLNALSISRKAEYSGEADINPLTNWPLPKSPDDMTEGPRGEPHLACLSIHDEVSVDASWANKASDMPLKLMELLHPSVIASLKSINVLGMPIASMELAHPILDASFVPFVQAPANAVPLFATTFTNLRTLVIDSVAIEHTMSTDWTAFDDDASGGQRLPAPNLFLFDLLPTCPILEYLIIDVWRFAYLPPSEQVVQFIDVLERCPTLRMVCFAMTRLSEEHLRELYQRVYLPGPDGKPPFPNLMRLFVANRDDSDGALQPTAAQVVAQANCPRSVLKKQAGNRQQVLAELPSDEDDDEDDYFPSDAAMATPLDWADSDDDIPPPQPTKGKKGPSPPAPFHGKATGLFARGPATTPLRAVRVPGHVTLRPAVPERNRGFLGISTYDPHGSGVCRCGAEELGTGHAYLDPEDGQVVCAGCYRPEGTFVGDFRKVSGNPQEYIKLMEGLLA